MKDIEFIYKDSLVSQDKINETSSRVSDYVEYIRSVADIDCKSEIKYENAESSINLPFDEGVCKKVNEVVRRVRTDNLKYIIVIGIGGSNLGTKAIYDSLRGQLDLLLVNETPKIIFADTVDSKLLNDIRTTVDKNIASKDEILVNVISKSGATTETIANFEIIYSFLKNKFDEAKDRVVVTTDYGSKLWDKAKEYGFEVLEIPATVGGRYSVFSAVGLFPLMITGFDIDGILSGARVMRNKCITEDVSGNPALMSAVIIYLHNKSGVSIHNSFFFNPELESVGRWYRQLMGESIGKRFDTDGEEINSGITPITSIGSTDLHSMAQLYIGGPKDKITTFVYEYKDNNTLSVPKEAVFNNTVKGIDGVRLSKIMDAIFDGTKESYRKNKLPFIEIRLPVVNEYILGQFLQFKMLEMMYLARLLRVNAFDQPDVEDYKVETKRILQN